MVRLALAGDVMTGRGIDQIMEHRVDPVLYEPVARSALRYLELAEQKSGPIPRPVDPGYIWGDPLTDLREARPEVTIVNLETAVTNGGTPWPDKGIHYRMHPRNVDCLNAVAVDVAVLANNHVLDWSVAGLDETLLTLQAAGLATTGAGRHHQDAWGPAVVSVSSRVVVIGLGTVSSGIPMDWAAGPDRPGVAIVSLDDQGVDAVTAALDRIRQPGDLIVASIHWGPNWGYHLPGAHRRFARNLIDQAGVHLVHGHSSHHPLGIEVYEGHLILHGCGDLINDYEGIEGHDEYRPGLGAWYLADIDAGSGALVSLELIPTKLERFRLIRPDYDELAWMASRLDEESSRLGTRLTLSAEGRIIVHR